MDHNVEPIHQTNVVDQNTSGKRVIHVRYCLHHSVYFIQGDEFMVELMKLQTIAEQGLALELLQQLVNSVMSSYTLAR